MSRHLKSLEIHLITALIASCHFISQGISSNKDERSGHKDPNSSTWDR
jgi:hypothetical protein